MISHLLLLSLRPVDVSALMMVLTSCANVIIIIIILYGVYEFHNKSTNIDSSPRATCIRFPSRPNQGPTGRYLRVRLSEDEPFRVKSWLILFLQYEACKDDASLGPSVKWIDLPRW